MFLNELVLIGWSYLEEADLVFRFCISNRRKRFSGLGLHPLVLEKISPDVFYVKKWCVSAHCFLKLCAKVGHIFASEFLYMVSSSLFLFPINEHFDKVKSL